MEATLKPLSECIRKFRDRTTASYEGASIQKLSELIVNCHSKLLFEREESERIDALRTVIWFANAALTKHGIAPRARRCLGPFPIKPTRLLHDVVNLDAPYIDLQWLAHRYPDHIPAKWSGVKSLMATALATGTGTGCSDYGYCNRDDALDQSFYHAGLLVSRRLSIARKCMELKLPLSIQSELRWLCSQTSRRKLREIDHEAQELRERMRMQSIKQLTPQLIDERLLVFKAWKLVGGGTNWQATANALEAMSGKRKTRQAIKDMITRLGEQKLVRRRNGRRKTIAPALFA